MAKYTVNFTGNTTKYIADAVKPSFADAYLATITASGSSFGGGTLAVYLSPDSGSTLIPAQDSSGNALTFTATGSRNLVLGVGSVNGDAIRIYVTMTGGTAQNVNIIMWDNRG